MNHTNIKMIAAVSANGIIGLNGKIPFHYSDDLKHFKKLTSNCNVIMGRKTYESLGKPLPNRNNIVISSSKIDNVETFAKLSDALNSKLQYENTWLIGGASIYEEGMNYVSKILLTLTPDIINDKNAIKFPWINPSIFSCEVSDLTDKLKLATYEFININH